jgi:hypothetical protein
MRAWLIILPIGLIWGAACGGDDSSTAGGTGASGGSGGTGGATGGSGGSKDGGSDVSSGGTGGATGGSSGAGGVAGKGGSAGSPTGGAGGAAGKGGGAGTGGATGGAAGTGGTAGKGGSSGTGGTAGAGGTAGTGGAAGAGGAAGTAGSAGTGGAGGSGGGDAGTSVSVVMHHNHLNRDGVFIDPVITKAAAATMHIDTTFAMATYQGMVTAQPLYLAGAGSVPDLVIVVTNQNHAIAFNAANGMKVWDQTLGTPLPVSNLASLKSGCASNITGQVGILGTPVIDPATRTIYLSSTQLSGSNARHMAYALDADTGMTRTGWPVDVGTKAMGSTAFNSLAESQRGALAIVGGRVLIPYGGYVGDCGDYRGWVVSIPASDPTQMSTFVTRALAGGIWAPSGIASDGTSAYFATGNTEGTVNNPFSHPAMYGDGESIFKLPPDLTRTMATTEYYVPTNWEMLDDTDADLGGTGPVLVDLAGSSPSKALVQLGKDGKAYLVNRDSMGGQSAPSAVITAAPSAIINAAAAYTTSMGTYVAYRATSNTGCPSGTTGQVRALRILPGSPPTMEIAWCGGVASGKSPAVSMTDANGGEAMVWTIGNDNKLRALDANTGTAVFNGGADTMSAVANFQTPIIANGRIFVAANAQVYAYKP